MDEEGLHVAGVRRRPGYLPLPRVDKFAHPPGERNDPVWRYGANIATPFMPSESALFRAPVVIDGAIIFGNNQEARVVAIERSMFTHEIEEVDSVSKWTASIPSWKITLRDDEGIEKRSICTLTSASFRGWLSG
jgi:hypothetical protein